MKYQQIDTIVNSPEETAALAMEFANQLQEGDIVALYGNLGAGKTYFTKAVCKALGVSDEATSPTFTIVNEYVTEDNSFVYHFDFYRITHEAELQNLGLESYFYDEHICLIEWPEKIPSALPKRRYNVFIEHIENNPTARKIRISENQK